MAPREVMTFEQRGAPYRRRFKRHTRVLLAVLVSLFLYLYVVPLAFDNPSLHAFAADVAPGTVPLVLVHGLGSAPDSFLEMQERLEADGLYVNGKDNSDDATVCAYARTHRAPFSFAVSYYEEQTGRALGRLATSLAHTVEKERRDTLDRYAERLAQRIETVLRCSGAAQVDIVGYSLGGVVVRKMLQRNDSVVRRVVFIGAPQRPGLYGSKVVDVGFGIEVPLGDIAASLESCKRGSGSNIIYSTILGRDLSRDCQVLEYALLEGVSSGLTRIEGVGTIAGLIDERGDGLIERDAVVVEGADNRQVSCEHNELRSPRLCPAAYDETVTLLGYAPDATIGFTERLLRIKLGIRTVIFGR